MADTGIQSSFLGPVYLYMAMDALHVTNAQTYRAPGHFSRNLYE